MCILTDGAGAYIIMRRRRRYKSSYERDPFDIKDFLTEVGQWALAVLVVVILAYSIVNFGAQTVTMIGQSMSPALNDRDVLLLNKSAYAFHEPERYDIIIFPHKTVYQSYLCRVRFSLRQKRSFNLASIVDGSGQSFVW